MSAITPKNVAEPLDAYDQTAAGEFRRMVAAAGEAMFRNDPVKVASAIIASVEQSPAPRRLTLGADAYREIHAALTSRLAMLEGQKELALSTEVGVTPRSNTMPHPTPSREPPKLMHRRRRTMPSAG